MENKFILIDDDVKSFFLKLASKVEAFEILYKEHLKEHDGNLLGHVLMGDFVDLYKLSIDQSEKEDFESIDFLVRSLDEAFKKGSDDLKNIIYVSFLEILTDDMEKYKIRLTPALMEGLFEMKQYLDNLEGKK